MKKLYTILGIASFVFLASCSSKKMSKGFQVSAGVESSVDGKLDGLNKDSLVFETAPN
ncbi:MAG: hypothetical protein K9J84_09500 [Bacteroidia bacterium]|nr:hypothetical protein [Bacteroidia bacterium]